VNAKLTERQLKRLRELDGLDLGNPTQASEKYSGRAFETAGLLARDYTGQHVILRLTQAGHAELCRPSEPTKTQLYKRLHDVILSAASLIQDADGKPDADTLDLIESDVRSALSTLKDLQERAALRGES
jgi:hypothetical protein